MYKYVCIHCCMLLFISTISCGLSAWFTFMPNRHTHVSHTDRPVCVHNQGMRHKCACYAHQPVYHVHNHSHAHNQGVTYQPVCHTHQPTCHVHNHSHAHNQGVTYQPACHTHTQKIVCQPVRCMPSQHTSGPVKEIVCQPVRCMPIQDTNGSVQEIVCQPVHYVYNQCDSIKQRILDHLRRHNMRYDEEVGRMIDIICEHFNGDMTRICVFLGHCIFNTSGFKYLIGEMDSSVFPYISRGILQIKGEEMYRIAGDEFVVRPDMMACLSEKAIRGALRVYDHVTRGCDQKDFLDVWCALGPDELTCKDGIHATRRDNRKQAYVDLCSSVDIPANVDSH